MTALELLAALVREQIAAGRGLAPSAAELARQLVTAIAEQDSAIAARDASMTALRDALELARAGAPTPRAAPARKGCHARAAGPLAPFTLESFAPAPRTMADLAWALEERHAEGARGERAARLIKLIVGTRKRAEAAAEIRRAELARVDAWHAAHPAGCVIVEGWGLGAACAGAAEREPTAAEAATYQSAAETGARAAVNADGAEAKRRAKEAEAAERKRLAHAG